MKTRKKKTSERSSGHKFEEKKNKASKCCYLNRFLQEDMKFVSKSNDKLQFHVKVNICIKSSEYLL